MKISINTPIARIEANLQEGQVKDLLRIALEYATGVAVIARQPEDSATAAEPAPRIEIPREDERPKYGATEDGYKGFLYIKCEKCGTTKGFCVKSPIKVSRCECGHLTELRNLKPLYANCECGESFKYQTNLTDSLSTINCLKCGSPVDLEYHEKKGVYETIK